MKLCFKFIYFRSDSRPYEIVKQPRHAPEEYKPKQGEIDLGTTYKWHLNSCRVQRVAIARPLERQVKKGKLDTVPAYKGNLPFQKLKSHKAKTYFQL